LFLLTKHGAHRRRGDVRAEGRRHDYGDHDEEEGKELGVLVDAWSESCVRVERVRVRVRFSLKVEAGRGAGAEGQDILTPRSV